LDAQESRVSFKERGDSIDFLVGGKLATTYQYADSQPRPLFFPVLADGVVPVTRAWPLVKDVKGESADHPHQQSFWFTHGDVIPEGATLTAKIRGVDGVDFWSINKGHGVIRLVKKENPRIEVVSDWRDAVVFTSMNEWVQDKLMVLREKRTLTFREAPGGWLVTVDASLTPGDYPVVFGDTKEGALGLRVNDQMRADKVGNGQIRIPGGRKGEKDCWGQKSSWCDYSGTVNDRKVGVTVFASPKNPAPTCWHVRGYGLMAGNPFGRTKARFPGVKDEKELIRLAKGETLRLVYAVHVYAGERSEAQIDAVEKGLWR